MPQEVEEDATTGLPAMPPMTNSPDLDTGQPATADQPRSDASDPLRAR